MLSIESPSPDLTQISHLKSRDDDYEKIKAASTNLALPDLEDADLLKNSSLPKFSIRDYVFNARSKDITTNWPFTEKSLQLCMKNGVTDLMPPFQPLDLMRNQSIKRSAVHDSNLLDKVHTSNPDGEPSMQQNDQVVSAYCDDAAKCKQTLILDCGSDKGEEISKMDSTTQPSDKKCRLIVKLRTLACPSTKEDNMPNKVSETMASKVCPVCKTFSSSSNTTLNAHIDQCLSGESTMKWSADSKVIKRYRIKPRKTRMMIDIYVTAPYCTVEDLDRRNGRIWAAKSTLTAEESELCIEEKGERVSNVAREEFGQEAGAVYIDTNGTKVRILSEFSDAPMSNVGEDIGPRKLVKGMKFLEAKKSKKSHAQKHRKFLKPEPRGNFCSPNPCPNFETSGGQERKFAMKGTGEKEVVWGQCLKAHEQIKLGDSGVIRRWVYPKQTGLTNKTIDQDDGQHSRYNLRRDFRGERDQSSLADSYMERNSLPRKSDSSINFISSPESSKRSKASKSSSTRKKLDLMQDHIEKQSEMKAISDKMSLTRTKLLKIRKKGSDIKISRKEEAIGFKSSVLEPQYYGYGVEETMDSSYGRALEDKFDGETSANKEAHGEHIAIEPPPNSSLGPEFNELPSPPSQCESEQHGEVNQGPLCGPQSPTCPNDEQDLFSPDEGGHVMIGEDTHMGTGFDSKEGQNSYFFEVDQIPIPGPPGSFLPSPGHMGSEDIQGNSSLTTSRVQSTENQYDNLVYRDLSDSPISATSTICNRTSARSDSRSSEKFFVEPHTLQVEIKHDFPNLNADPVVENFVPNSQAANLGAEQINIEALTVDVMFPEKAPVSLKNEQLCCCSRKEVKFPMRVDYDLPSPSLSTPILRLMGKNLMVANKDEDVSLQHRQYQSCSINAVPNLQSRTVSEVFPASVPNLQSPTVPQDRHEPNGQHYGATSNNYFTSYADVRTSTTPSCEPGVVFQVSSSGISNSSRLVSPFYNSNQLEGGSLYGANFLKPPSGGVNYASQVKWKWNP